MFSNHRILTTVGVGVVAAILTAGCSSTPSGDNGGSVKAEQALDPLATTEELDAAANAGRPLLVDFYADWCGPCKQQAPVLARLKEDYDGRVDFYRVNVDEARALASEYEIRSVPTLVLFKDGQAVKRLVGYHSREQLQAELDALAG